MHPLSTVTSFEQAGFCGLSQRQLAPCLLESAVLIVLASLIGMYRLDQSGTLWPDGPRYANAGAMIHDWLRSGDYLHPLRFAEANYVQYPAFSIPFHPPAYPG